MFVKSFAPINYQSHSTLKFKGSDSLNATSKNDMKDDSYYCKRAEQYIDLYHECAGAGCDDEEIVAENERKMAEIEKEFKAANRRILDYVPRNTGEDD